MISSTPFAPSSVNASRFSGHKTTRPGSPLQTRPLSSFGLKNGIPALRFGKVDKPAPKEFLQQYTNLKLEQFQALERYLMERSNKQFTLEEIKSQIPPTRDDAPHLEIVEAGNPYGKALRAAKNFQQGDVVINFQAKNSLTGEPAFSLIPANTIYNSKPVMDYSHYVLMTDDLALTFPQPQKISYLNHGEEGKTANVEVSYKDHGFVATKPIRKNELIFSDYTTGEYNNDTDNQVFDSIHSFALAPASSHSDK